MRLAKRLKRSKSSGRKSVRGAKNEPAINERRAQFVA
jgi:hypothetical protein